MEFLHVHWFLSVVPSAFCEDFVEEDRAPSPSQTHRDWQDVYWIEDKYDEIAKGDEVLALAQDRSTVFYRATVLSAAERGTITVQFEGSKEKCALNRFQKRQRGTKSVRVPAVVHIVSFEETKSAKYAAQYFDQKRAERRSQKKRKDREWEALRNCGDRDSDSDFDPPSNDKDSTRTDKQRKKRKSQFAGARSVESGTGTTESNLTKYRSRQRKYIDFLERSLLREREQSREWKRKYDRLKLLWDEVEQILV